MSGPGTAVAVALLFAALATAGCGLGPGSGVKDAELTVTRDYGTVPVLHRRLADLTESDTVMRALERTAEITTSYGGDFVQSIDGVEGESRSGERFDWLFYVNGVESTVGAGAYSLHGGESVWWDYRDWSAALRVPAVVGSWPQPFLGGYDGKQRPVAVECLGGGSACDEVDERLEEAGVEVAAHRPSGAIRILVGPWARVRSDPAAAQLERGPQVSGVFADLHRKGSAYRFVGLDEAGDAAVDFGPDSGLVAATRRYEEPPVWMVTGTSGKGVRAAAGLLDAGDLRDHYAVAVDGGKETPLPMPSR
jgi:Domain of unknown function (DUF4430)